jgi:hypothetical protein
MNGALFAYLYARLSAMGVSLASVSQLVGFPSQFPSVSLVDWNTGRGNARLRILQLLVESFPAGSAVVETTVSAPGALFPPDALAALGSLSATGERRILLVNKKYQPLEVTLGLGAAVVESVDRDSGSVVRTTDYPELGRLTLGGFGVAVVKLRPAGG